MAEAETGDEIVPETAGQLDRKKRESLSRADNFRRLIRRKGKQDSSAEEEVVKSVNDEEGNSSLGIMPDNLGQNVSDNLGDLPDELSNSDPVSPPPTSSDVGPVSDETKATTENVEDVDVKPNLDNAEATATDSNPETAGQQWGSMLGSAAGSMLGMFGRVVGLTASTAWTLTKTAVMYVAEWPEYDEDSDREVVESESESESEQGKQTDADLKAQDRLFHICNELMTTEEAYVQRIGVLVTVKEKTSKIVSPEVAKIMFNNIEVIHQFHHDNLLPQLKERMEHWTEHRKVGDIMKRFAPFLKLYTEYVKNFEKAAAAVDNYEEKSSGFAALLKEIKNSPDHGRLKVQAHMLEPVQRVPRYELLLRDYLKRLPADSPDRPDTEKAQSVVSEAASHFEHMMKRDSNIGDLMKLQNQLDGAVNIVKSQREMVRQGKLFQVNPRTGKPTERCVFLFNDIMLICSEQVLSVMGRYKVKQLLELQETQLSDGNNLDIPNTFYLKTTERVTELCTQTPEEKLEWQEVIRKQIGDSTKKKLLRQGTRRIRETVVSRSALGKQAPVWVHNSSVSMCMVCAVEFNPIRRKKHCRACGIVVCSKCSSHAAKLEYDNGKSQRVCDECFVILQEDETASVKVGYTSSGKVKAEGEVMKRGFFYLSSDFGKTWKKRWFSLHDSVKLYSFKAHQDISPLTALSLEGFSVEFIDGIQTKKEKMLKLQSTTTTYYLYDESDAVLNSWFAVLKLVLKTEDISSVNPENTPVSPTD